ncbi:4-(cytidine 5'-diphospho)-2-C-methyl-D-erythritol kinase [Opitutaceae bacterium EW11]|nr:4-(cytidine 5'-diphospho)-2-C-methyl-D-erythritol kinase [Opitutaceae bacterium EW11]
MFRRGVNACVKVVRPISRFRCDPWVETYLIAPNVSALTVFAPAKINLFLAITGRRPDGFHDLLSVVVPLQFGDRLEIEPRDVRAYSLECDAPGVPVDETNLVLRAAKLFSEATGIGKGSHFRLLKRVPAGAGLGGGSSDGTAALCGLNRLAGSPLDRGALQSLAAQLGSDCALFLEGRPCVMRGRGEQITPLDEDAAGRLSGRRILVFKPSFGISTAWAYGQMAQRPETYLRFSDAEARLNSWTRSPSAPAEEIMLNNMEAVAFRKFRALPALRDRLQKSFGLKVGMSGSGSACFSLLEETTDLAPITACIQDAWGADVFLIETRIGQNLVDPR